MNETPASDSSNPDIVTQLASSDDPIRPSVAVSSSGVPSSAEVESVQMLQAEYERTKAEMEEQRKRIFREELAKLKVEQQLFLEQQQAAFEHQRAALASQLFSRFSLMPSFDTPISSAFSSATPQGPASDTRRRHDLFDVGVRSSRDSSWVQVNKASVQGACKPLLAVETLNYGSFSHTNAIFTTINSLVKG
jgi:hypothetical protein